MHRPRPGPAGRSRPPGRSPPRRRHRPSPPAARAGAPTAARDDAPAVGAGPGQSLEPEPDGSSRPPAAARGQPRKLAAARTGKMQTRAWVISLVVGGLENLRPPHGPCPPYPPSSEHLLSDFDAALVGSPSREAPTVLPRDPAHMVGRPAHRRGTRIRGQMR